MGQSLLLFQTHRCILRHGSRKAQEEDHWAGAGVSNEIKTPGLGVWHIDIEQQAVLVATLMQTPVVQPTECQIHFRLKTMMGELLFP